MTDTDDLDYEVNPSIQVEIRASDGSLTDNAELTINLTDDRDEDTDGDGLTEAQEEDIYRTSDTNDNSDGDGLNDDRVAVGRDPADSDLFGLFGSNLQWGGSLTFPEEIQGKVISIAAG